MLEQSPPLLSVKTINISQIQKLFIKQRKKYFMQNVSYIKEAVANASQNISLILLNQKQIKDALNFVINNFLAQQKTMVIVALSMSPTDIIQMIPQNNKKNVYIVDCFSQQATATDNIINAGSPSDLTNIQVVLDLIEKKNNKNKIIIFDSISVLAVYNNNENLGRFLHLFTNKMLLHENTTLFFASKDAIEEDTLKMAKEFSSKVYDYSGLAISSIEEAK